MSPSVPKKPILKRRSISQLLSLPASPFFNQIDSDEEEEDLHLPTSAPPVRPPLVHTKSDTHINMRGRPFRKTSPPRIIAQDAAASQVGPTPPVAQAATLSDGSGSTSSDQDLSAGSSVDASGPTKKKHISFNTFVEQCIAIEKPKVKRSATGPTIGARFYDAYDDGSVAFICSLIRCDWLRYLACVLPGPIPSWGTMASTTSRRRCTTSTTTLSSDPTRKTMTTMCSRCGRRPRALAQIRRHQCGRLLSPPHSGQAQPPLRARDRRRYVDILRIGNMSQSPLSRQQC